MTGKFKVCLTNPDATVVKVYTFVYYKNSTDDINCIAAGCFHIRLTFDAFLKEV